MAGHLQRPATSSRLQSHQEKAQVLLEAGAHWHDSAGPPPPPGTWSITMLGFPTDVEQSYLGAGRHGSAPKPGALLIDMTTSSRCSPGRIADAAAKRGLSSLDAPGFGGDVGAKEARSPSWSVQRSRLRPKRSRSLRSGKKYSLQGPAGAGQHCRWRIKSLSPLACSPGSKHSRSEKGRARSPPPCSKHCGGAATSWSMVNLGRVPLAGITLPVFM